MLDIARIAIPAKTKVAVINIIQLAAFNTMCHRKVKIAKDVGCLCAKAQIKFGNLKSRVQNLELHGVALGTNVIAHRRQIGEDNIDVMATQHLIPFGILANFDRMHIRIVCDGLGILVPNNLKPACALKTFRPAIFARKKT